MTPVIYAEILELWQSGKGTGDLYCLPKPPYRPMVITYMDATHCQVAEYPPRPSRPPRRLTRKAFEVLGYVRYAEDLGAE